MYHCAGETDILCINNKLGFAGGGEVFLRFFSPNTSFLGQEDQHFPGFQLQNNVEVKVLRT